MIRELDVLRRERVTPRMVRLVLGGPGLDGWTSTTPDEHVKIVFADPDGQVRPPTLAADGTVEWPRPFPPTREYTIRRFDAVRGELWIDFVVHPGGLASDWAETVGTGSGVWIAGPRSGEPVPPAAGRHVLLGDHTALPAIARWLEELDATVAADVVVLVPDAGERQDLAADVTWLHEDDPTAATLVELLDRIGPEPDGTTYLWAAGEAGLLKPVRAWARAHGFARGSCDIAGYWRRSRTRPAVTRRPA